MLLEEGPVRPSGATKVLTTGSLRIIFYVYLYVLFTMCIPTYLFYSAVGESEQAIGNAFGQAHVQLERDHEETAGKR